MPLMSSLLFLSIRYLFLEVLMTKPAISQVPRICGDGWFGPRCMLQCHCSISICDKETGSCPVGEPCAPSYFGPSCQYVNVAFIDGQYSNPAFLRDEDVKTCNDNISATSVTLKLVTAQRLIWFRLHLRAPSTFQLFLVTLQNGANLCPKRNTIHIDSYTLDVTCITEVNADTITITGEMAAHVCSIIVSGGRNVALRQTTEQVSNYYAHTYGQSGRAVDGLTTPGETVCIRTKHDPLGGWWKVTFQPPYVLHKLVIYNNNEVSSASNTTRVRRYIGNSKVLMPESANPATSVIVFSVMLPLSKHT